jgi:hypothetical protein
VRWLALVLLVGCSTTKSALRDRFAAEHGCPKDDVRVDEQGGNQYRASGCGQRAVYSCGVAVGLGDPGKSCVEQGVRGREPPDTGGRRVPPPDPRIPDSPR